MSKNTKSEPELEIPPELEDMTDGGAVAESDEPPVEAAPEETAPANVCAGEGCQEDGEYRHGDKDWCVAHLAAARGLKVTLPGELDAKGGDRVHPRHVGRAHGSCSAKGTRNHIPEADPKDRQYDSENFYGHINEDERELKISEGFEVVRPSTHPGMLIVRRPNAAQLKAEQAKQRRVMRRLEDKHTGRSDMIRQANQLGAKSKGVSIVTGRGDEQTAVGLAAARALGVG